MKNVYSIQTDDSGIPHVVTILTHLTPSHTHTHPSPSGLSYEDTYNTLKYADRAKQIKTKVLSLCVYVHV